MRARAVDSLREFARVRVGARAVLPAALLVASAACGPARLPAPVTVSLRLAGSPPGATVVIDEETLGTLDFVSARGVALPPGVHHVTVKAAGYFPSDQTVEAKEGAGPIRLAVALVAVPD